jgi:hypothetical protein
MVEVKPSPPKGWGLRRLCRHFAPLSPDPAKKSDHEALDFLNETPQILADIGLEEGDLPDNSTEVEP